MGKVTKTLYALVVCSLCAAPAVVLGAWTQDGSFITMANYNQVSLATVPDGAGGAIVVWQDGRNGNNDIFAQRIDGSGNRLWSTSDLSICTYAGDQAYPVAVSDGAGGAIVAWQDNRGGFYDIYAQRVDSSGAALWTANGVALCTASYGQTGARLISDGTGGAIVAWQDYRSASHNDIYVRRIDASGSVRWTANGVSLCALAGEQSYPSIASDGAGGAIVVWQDNRGGNNDIYSQMVDSTGAVQWTADGIALCAATGDQEEPRIVTDGAGGAIVTWYDERGGASCFLYGQRVDGSGGAQWATDGVSLVATSSGTPYHFALPDGSGGVFLVLSANRTGNYDIYAQRVDGAGEVQWTTGGATLCAAAGTQNNPVVISDEEGGLILAWQDVRSGNADIYAQRVDGDGAPRWLANGVVLCAATGTQNYPAIVSDGADGAIVAWPDYRNGSYSDIYAQHIDGQGRRGRFQPGILSVADVPGDQGGQVRITIDASSLDTAVTKPVCIYNVWQRIDDLAAPALSGGSVPRISAAGQPVGAGFYWPVESVNGRIILRSKDFAGSEAFASGTWELLGSFAACQYEQYIYRAGTLADSTESGIPYAVCMVSAHTTDPLEWYMSDSDSGYSVDNLPPGTPEGLAAQQSYEPEGLALGWDANEANDLSHYAVYRGTNADFVPAQGNRIAQPADAGYFDGEWRWDSGFCYKVSALDIHGNESGFTLLQPGNVTGEEIPSVPSSSYIGQNYPNPFNPSTMIEFGLAAAGRVSLRIYDAAGRLVHVIVDEDRPAGRYVGEWDGRDANGRAVSSGVYFCRIEAGTFTQARKLVLLK